MNLIDLSHTLENNMTIFPGDALPLIEKSSTIESDFYNETHLGISSHKGTHLDAPYHMLEKGKSLDEMPLLNFVGKGIVIDASSFENSEIPLLAIKENAAKIKGTDFVLFYTGWDKYWKTKKYFSGFPVLSKEAAKELEMFKLKGIGVDCLSIDPIDSESCSIHHTLLTQGLIAIENLSNLDLLLKKTFILCCFPLKFNKADGSPTRAVAIVQEKNRDKIDIFQMMM